MEDFGERLGSAFSNHIITAFNAIPGVIAAIIWLAVAFLVANLVKGLIVKLLKAIKLEKYLIKWGVTTETKNSAIEFIGKLAFFVVFLLFLPVALGKLGITSITGPITGVVDSFINMIPKIVAAVIVLVVGLFIAKLVKDLLIPILKTLKIDTLQEKAGVQ